jgi:hypothetical protein
MKVRVLATSLRQHAEKPIHIVLPNGDSIPAHFHITEVGHVIRRFIDCGGTVRLVESCLLQAWVPEGGTEHRLTAGKLAKILEISRQIVPSQELEAEIEYDCGVVGQYTIANINVQSDVLVFTLGNKTTDCLARERCGVEPAASAASCCGGSGCGCS